MGNHTNSTRIMKFRSAISLFIVFGAFGINFGAAAKCRKDNRPRWCNENKYHEQFYHLCMKEGSLVRNIFCCKTCLELHGVEPTTTTGKSTTVVSTTTAYTTRRPGPANGESSDDEDVSNEGSGISTPVRTTTTQTTRPLTGLDDQNMSCREGWENICFGPSTYGRYPCGARVKYRMERFSENLAVAKAAILSECPRQCSFLSRDECGETIDNLI